MRLRDYQQEACAAIDAAWERTNSCLLVLPTGCGKTVCFAHEVGRCTGRVLVLAHRSELIFQACDKIERVTGERPDIEMADYRAADGESFWSQKKKCVVSSVQTQCAGDPPRMENFDPGEFEMIIIDEAHHATAATYRRIIDYYTQENHHIKVLGVTATPDRADKMALGIVFDEVAYVYEINDAVNDGYLVRPHNEIIEVDGLDFNAIKTTAGDLNQGQLGEAMCSEHMVKAYEEELHKVVSPTMELAGAKRTLVFTVTVDQAERMTEIFNRHNPGCARFVSGKTPKPWREQTIAEFNRGVFNVLVNVGVFTEGFDEPGIECIVIARPTKSRALYAQMVGRGTRTLPGVIDGLDSPEERLAAIASSAKPHVEIYDFAGNAGRHKLISCADILGGNYDEEVVQRAKAKAKEQENGAPGDVMDQLRDAHEELERERREQAAREHIKATAKFRRKQVDPFDVFDIRPRAEVHWHKGREISEKMRVVLERNGVETKDMNYTNAKQILQEIFDRRDRNLCTYKQAKLLGKFGYDRDVSFTEAKQIIDRIAANGWKRPDPVEVT